MALYTETLADYLANGNSLPEMFSQLPFINIEPNINGSTFTTLFTNYYSDWEIGFETEELFKKKLEAKANIVCPLYNQKIRQINQAIENGIFNNNATSSRTSRNYFNNETISQLSDAQGNSAVTENIESNIPIDSQTDVIIKFQNQIDSLYQRLLDEFKSLFMGLC